MDSAQAYGGYDTYGGNGVPEGQTRTDKGQRGVSHEHEFVKNNVAKCHICGILCFIRFCIN